jgi:hypothetical protein
LPIQTSTGNASVSAVEQEKAVCNLISDAGSVFQFAKRRGDAAGRQFIKIDRRRRRLLPPRSKTALLTAPQRREIALRQPAIAVRRKRITDFSVQLERVTERRRSVQTIF